MHRACGVVLVDGKVVGRAGQKVGDIHRGAGALVHDVVAGSDLRTTAKGRVGGVIGSIGRIRIDGTAGSRHHQNTTRPVTPRPAHRCPGGSDTRGSKAGCLGGWGRRGRSSDFEVI